MATLNLALDLGCGDEIINMINGFINCKKNTIEETNNENKEENLQTLDPSSKMIAINPSNPNLYVREMQQNSQQASSSRAPLNTN
ncbi:hypothetical protein C1646_759943 [Rhizophagus diaphanus]|nr:hypothetical protein C1646_759943 [Rhizophagus diaphanus] [Rhizophagus sp. MUCL 43196]